MNDRKTLPSRVGGFVPGEYVLFRGMDLHKDLKDVDWLELYTFGITGRRYSPAEIRVLHAIWAMTSYPDVRLWNNRVAALAGSQRSTGTLAVSAALAVSEASIYGRGIDIRAIDFLLRTTQALQQGKPLSECVEAEIKVHRGLAGFGRPLTPKDERLEPMMDLLKEVGFDEKTHVRLIFEIEEFLQGKWRWKMTHGAMAAAVAADLGFSAREYHLFVFPAFLAGVQPCVVDAFAMPEGELISTSCNEVLYEGVGSRQWEKC